MPVPAVQVVSQVPAMHLGQGEVPFAVRNTAELSGKLPLKTPVPLSSVPLAGVEKVFCTHVDVPALAIGRYGPKVQPMSEQFLLLPVSAAVRPDTV